MTSETKLYTLRSLARHFKGCGLSVAWFKAEAEAGRIPHLKAGKRMLFNLEAVESALLARAAEGGSDAK